MPIDIDQLRALVKFAGTIGSDAGSQAMAAAAQAAKPAGGIPLPKPVEDKEDPAGSALDEQKAQIEQDKLEQQRRKELDAKENEIRGLKHELELEQVERQRATHEHELDLRVRQEQDKLKSEREKLDRDKFQLVQEKARQDNMFKAEEMKHQADMDKITFKQEAEIAKQQAKATADLAKQQAQQYIKTTDQARKASDKYYVDAQNKLKQVAPAVSPALQNQLDSAISSLNRFKAIHKKQTAIPKPGTPPDLTKLAMIKWAETWEEKVDREAHESIKNKIEEEDYRTLYDGGAHNGGSAYGAARAYADLNNKAEMAKDDGRASDAQRYTQLARRAKDIAGSNFNQAAGKTDIDSKKDTALYRSYTDTRTRLQPGSRGQSIPGFGWLGWLTGGQGLKYINESQMDRDANAYKDYKAAKDADENTNLAQYIYNETAMGLLSPFYNFVNGINDTRANMRNADYFGANRFWNTTFDDNRMRDAYQQSIANHSYGDSIMGDLGRTGLHGLSAVLSLVPNPYARIAGAVLAVPSYFVGSQELAPGGQFNFTKGASTTIPVPGAPPITKKADAGTYTAQAANTGYDWSNLNNPWYNNPYSSGAGAFVRKWVSPIISSMTGNAVNIAATPGRFAAYLKPKSIIPGQRLAYNVVENADYWKGGLSPMHKVVAQAAKEKHFGGSEQVKNYNGTADFRSNNSLRFI